MIETTPSAAPTAAILTRPDGATIAYHGTPRQGPGVVFLGGFMSDMTGAKAQALERHCRARGRAFLRFDYFGHGQSSGTFTDGTVGRWADDALAAIEALTEGPQILVGSSMGGWIMLLTALRRPERVAGLIGVAAAPDFTEDLIFAAMSENQRLTMMETGVVNLSDAGEPPYPVARTLIEDGRRHRLLTGPIAVGCPIRLLHGLKDVDVPWRTALAIAERVTGGDVEVTLVKDGTHRMSRESDLALLCRTVDTLTEQVR